MGSTSRRAFGMTIYDNIVETNIFMMVFVELRGQRSLSAFPQAI